VAAKLEGDFDKSIAAKTDEKGRREGWASRWTLLLLPMITVLREGLEAVVFVGGVSLGQSARSIPAATITGLICGLIIGYLIYASSSRVSLTIFLVISTNILFLLGAGLFSKSVGDFERKFYNHKTGGDAAEAGSGPGSYNIKGNIWHLDYGNPEDNSNGGWMVFNALLGWDNNGTYGTVLSYVFYWLAVTVALVVMKWKEGRTSVFGKQSAAGLRRDVRHRERATGVVEKPAGSEEEVKRESSNDA